MFCYLNEAFTGRLKNSSILKRQGRKIILFFVLFCLFYFPGTFIKKVFACDSSKSSNAVFPLHPKQFKQFEKRVNVHLRSICVYI